MVSVLIPTFNEARNILGCLQSVSWADEIVVVDSCSTDATPALASRFGARVVDFQWNGRSPKKKNWALENIAWRNEWVLVVDADERITTPLAYEIESVVTCSSLRGYYLNRRFMFMGRWIRHCGYYPSWNLRLFRHANGRYEHLVDHDTQSGDNEVHEHVILDGATGFLRHDMLHLAYPDIFTWVEKHNRYSNWEAHVEAFGTRRLRHGQAAVSRKRPLRESSRQLPFRPALRFAYHYFLRCGFLDGYEGYVLCRLLGMYEMLAVFKSQELLGKSGKSSLQSKAIGFGTNRAPLPTERI
jgi:glycosyltransferase involved in cell wall biosynthesis